MGAAPASANVVDLARRGRKIAAIKLYRSESGAGLAEAKRAVEALELAAPATSPQEMQDADGTSPRSRRAAAMLAAIVLGLAGVGVTGSGLVRAYLASSWPETSASIVSLRRVPQTQDSAERVELEYVFAVGETEYRGDRVSYTTIWGTFFTDATYERYPVGAVRTVHYDPVDPTRSVLEIEVPPFYWVLATVSASALVWGIGCWVGEVRYERSERERVSLLRGEPT